MIFLSEGVNNVARNRGLLGWNSFSASEEMMRDREAIPANIIPVRHKLKLHPAVELRDQGIWVEFL